MHKSDSASPKQETHVTSSVDIATRISTIHKQRSA